MKVHPLVIIVLAPTGLHCEGSRFRTCVDLEPPAPAVGSLILYSRAPWGNGSESGPRFVIQGEVGAVEGGVSVVAEDANGMEIGRTVAAANGSFAALELSPVDRLHVWVVAVDQARNRSERTPVREGIWTGSLAERESDAAPANPHAAVVIPRRVRELSSVEDLRASDTPVAVRADLALRDLREVQVRAVPFWRQVGPLPIDWHHEVAGVAYDSRRGRLLTLKSSDNAQQQAAYEWDGYRAWPAGDLKPGLYGAVAYDAAKSKIVHFGGVASDGSGPVPRDETWTWDGTSWTEHIVKAPPARFGHSLTYDPVRKRVVLFGGNADFTSNPLFDAPLDDVWEWDGDRWHSIRPVGPRPGARWFHAATFHEGTGCVLVSGGLRRASADVFEPQDDLWAWNGKSWREIEVTGPPPFFAHTMAFDVRRRELLLLGGARAPTTKGRTELVFEFWIHDGDRWRPGPAPPARSLLRPAAYYDSVAERVRVFGGLPPAESSSRVLEWTGSEWIDQGGGSHSPAARFAHAMAYDPASREVILFGGATVQGFSDDTWSLRGLEWRPLAASGPSARAGAAMGHVPDVKRLMLVGGSSNSVGRDLGDAWFWTEEGWVGAPALPEPLARHTFTMATSAEALLIFGGARGAQGALQAPCRFAMDLWRCALVQRPPALVGPSMAFDAARDEVLLFGGHCPTCSPSLTNKLWSSTEWPTFEELSSAGAWPSPRWQAILFYDKLRGRTIMMGGLSEDDADTEAHSDYWEWDGSAWRSSRLTDPSPLPRAVSPTIYDDVRARAVLFGGWGGSETGQSPEIHRQDLWIYPSWEMKPSVFLSFDWSSSGLASEDVTVESIGFELDARGTGVPTGYEARVWNHALGRWIAMEETRFGGGTLFLIPFESSRAVGPGANRISMLVEARGYDDHEDDAEMAIDYASVRVRYKISPSPNLLNQ